MMCCCNCNKGQTVTFTFHTTEGLDEATIAKRAASEIERYERDRRLAVRAG
jgi:hypothetical protein